MRNHLTLYEFITTEVFDRIREDGYWAAPEPAPLTGRAVVIILEEVARHPRYYRQHIETLTQDEKRVVLQNGVVTVLEPERL